MRRLAYILGGCLGYLVGTGLQICITGAMVYRWVFHKKDI